MASRAEIVERLIPHLAKLSSEPVQLDETSDLTKAVSLDSVRFLDILLDIEDEFDVVLPLDELPGIHTVGDMAAVIDQRIQDR